MPLIVLTVVAVLLIGGALTLRGFARGFLRPGKRRSTKTPATFELDGEAFALPTDGGAIRGWLIRAAREPRLTVVLAHGWQSHAGDMMGWVAPIVGSGCHVIVYDTLGHGDSDPSEFTSIRHFRRDLRSVIAFARTLPDASPGVAVMGHSMGGAAALLAAADEGDLRGVIAAAAPTDAFEITREWLDARGLPGGLLILLLRPFWVPIVKGPYTELKPIERISQIRMPVLVIHGSADTQVPVQHAERLASAHPGVRLEVFEGADHLSLPKHPRYYEVISSFLRKLAATSR